MGWLTSKRKEVYTMEVAADDILVDELGEYNPHLESLLTEVRELIPREFESEVFIGGGFAAHLAGVTTEHGDIDIFVPSEHAFNALKLSLPKTPGVTGRRNGHDVTIIESKGYGRVLKCRYKDIRFDLIDGHEYLDSNSAYALFRSFDINWAMACIYLDSNEISIHRNALKTTPMVNLSRLDVAPERTLERVERYANRLKRDVDQHSVKVCQQLIRKRMKQSKHVEDTWSNY